MSIKRFLSGILFSTILFASAHMVSAAEQKIAIIDVQKVVESSSQVKALRASQEANAKSLAAFVKNAQADINKQKDDKAKQELAQKYEKQLAAKRETFAKDYAAKLKVVDKNVNDKISQKAREMGYTLVLPKTAVLYGGEDITEIIIKAVN